MQRMQSSTLIRVGLVGAGAIAQFHVRALKNLSGVKLVAVCDPDYHKAIALQQSAAIQAFDSIDGMCKAVALDAVHVLVPPDAHAATSVECLNRGWHVLVEKPLATTVEECLEIEAVAARAGRFVGVNHNTTFLPCFLQLIQDIQARKLGAIENVQVCTNVALPQLAAGQHGYWFFASPGNILLELGSHPLSAIIRLIGPVDAVRTLVSGRVVLNNGSEFFDTWQMLLSCQRAAAQWYFSVGRNLPHECIHVVGQDGAAVVDLLRNTYTFSNRTRFVGAVDNLVDAWRRSCSYLGGGLHNVTGYAVGFLGIKDTSDIFSVGMRKSIAAFHDAIRRNEKPPVGITESTAVIHACQQIMAAAGRQEK
jgi:predicted dehydrogenase